MLYYNPWTPEKTKQLKELFEKGLSGAEIAREMGKTRNAILGKLDRLGLKRAKNPAKKKHVPLLNFGAKRQTLFTNRVPRVSPYDGAKPRHIIPEFKIDHDNLIDFQDLKTGICRYPVGDKDFKYCGKPTEGRNSFCSDCSSRVHVKSGAYRK